MIALTTARQPSCAPWVMLKPLPMRSSSCTRIGHGYKRMGQAAAETARSRFSMERVAADYAQVLNTVVAEAPVAPLPLPWKEFRVPPPY